MEEGTGLEAEGWNALQRCDWTAAREHFERATETQRTPSALEGLGTAAWWLADEATVFRAREEAYQLYREHCLDDGAARIALMLAWNHLEFRGAPAVANGWVQLARRHLERVEPGPEWAMLHLFIAHRALMDEGDIATATAEAKQASSIGREIGSVDLEMVGIAIEGLALVTQGRVAEGMALLDEAVASACNGTMTDPDAIGSTCCYLIYGCERVRDYPRAAQWCQWLEEFSTRWGHRPLLGICRAHYAGVLIHQGRWREAEDELEDAGEQLTRELPPLVVEAIVRLAELRRRQQRLDEAGDLFAQAKGHPLSEVGLVALALERGDPDALDRSERCLRRIPREARTERVAALELVARARFAVGDHQGGQAACHELAEIAELVGTAATRAASLAARGIGLRLEGKPSAGQAVLDEAAEIFSRSGLPYEAATAEAESVLAASAAGRLQAAELALRSAVSRLEEIGATAAAARVRRLLDTPLSPSDESAAAPSLTPREVEVLRLIARGLTDRDMAEHLRLSEHTVHRHASNLLTKLGVSTRAAAVAEGSRQGLL